MTASKQTILPGIHLGQGERGKQRLAALRQMAQDAGHTHASKPSVGKMIVAMADGGGAWTHIVQGDQATLPSISANEIQVACHRKNDVRIRRVIPLVYSLFVGGGGYWHYNVESHGKIGIEHWTPYAWQAWPAPPPLPSEGGEQCLS